MPLVIVRVLTATVRMDRAGQFNALLRTQLPLLREQPGLVYVKLARRLEGAVEQVVLFEEWRDPDAMYAWTGPHIDRPRLVPGAEELIEDLQIRHYEALDIDPPQPECVWPPAMGATHAKAARPEPDPDGDEGGTTADAASPGGRSAGLARPEGFEPPTY